MAVIRTTIYLEEKDRRTLSLIQDRYGLATLSDAIRFSIRVVREFPPTEARLVPHWPQRGRKDGKLALAREQLIAQARQTNQATEQVIAKTREFLAKQRRSAR